MSTHRSFFKNLTSRRTLLWTLLISSVIACSGILYYSISSYQPSVTQNILVPEKVVGKIITLKLLQEQDFLAYHNMFSQQVRKDLEFPEHITISYTISYLREELQKANEGTVLAYCIFDNKDNKLIGHLEIRDLNDDDPGQFGCWVNEHYWGGGRFQEALALISKTYFTLKKNETKYNAYVRLWNKRSFYALKKFGFKEVGYVYGDSGNYKHRKDNIGNPAYYLLELERSQIMKFGF